MANEKQSPAGAGGARAGRHAVGGVVQPHCTTPCTKTQNELLDAALGYAARGWPVLPLWWPDDGRCACGNPTCTSPAKHLIGRLVPHGLKDATTDEKTIRRWWNQYPKANIAIATGGSFVVLDVDGNEGNAALGGRLDGHAGPVARTGKGLHFFFQHPGGVVRNFARRLAGIDLRGDGGYVVAPPSWHINGLQYCWVQAPDETPLPPCPGWLLALIRDPHPAPTAPQPLEPVAVHHLARLLAGAADADTAVIRATWPDCPAGDRREAIQAWLLTQPGLLRAVLAADPATPSPPTPNPVAVPVTTTTPTAAGLNNLHMTDSGNAEAMALLFGNQLRFDHTRRIWLAWDGIRWAQDRDGEVERLALQMARDRQRAAVEEEDKGKRKRLFQWALASENRARLRAAIACAESTRPFAATADQFDRDPWLLGCANGILDLRSGDLLIGRPDLMVSRSTGIPYDPGATCPRWLQFLKEIFQGDQDTIDFCQRAVGYTLTGSIREQCLFLCYGTGENGKTAFLLALRTLLGEYACNTDFATFLESAHPRDSSSATPDLAALLGSRLVTASEAKEGRRLNEARIKSLTGGDPVTARPLYSSPITFVPTFKIWVSVNYPPIIQETSPAIWRRVRLIPFMARFPPGIADPELPHKLAAEAPGILAWAVRGCQAWQAGGLQPSHSVRAATEAYRLDQDVLGRFLAECTLEGAGMTARASDLYQAYCEWCNTSGEKAVSATAFGRRMTERYQKIHTRSGYLYQDVGLLERGQGA